MKCYEEWLNEDTSTANIATTSSILGKDNTTVSRRSENINLVYQDNIRTMNRWVLETENGTLLKNESDVDVRYRTEDEAIEYASRNGYNIITKTIVD